MQPDGNDLIMGGGIPSISWATKVNGQWINVPYGTRVSGYVLAPPITSQQTDYQDRSPKFFKDGKPMLQSAIRLQTDQRDPTVEHDDGERVLYVKGADITRLRAAIRATGAKGIEIGGWLSCTYVRDEQPVGNLNPAKVREFVYQRPAAPVDPGQQQATYATGSPVQQVPNPIYQPAVSYNPQPVPAQYAPQAASPQPAPPAPPATNPGLTPEQVEMLARLQQAQQAQNAQSIEPPF